MNARSLFVTVLLIVIAGCQSEPPAPVTSRVVVIGFDGMDPKLLDQFMAAGLMPEFAKLRDQGHYQPLATTNPPQSPVAWASFATGHDAGSHGIYDFLHRDPLTYQPVFSIAGFTPPEYQISVGDWVIPLAEGQLLNQRRGEPFWNRLARNGTRATLQRVPVTYPPDDIHRMIAGMGVPDLRGTQGTYTLFSTRRMPAAESGGRVEYVQMSNSGWVETQLEGPAHPLKPEAPALSLPMQVRFTADSAEVTLAGETRTLSLHTWSDWWPLRFDFPLGSIPGMVRLRLLEGFPRPLLYVSPIQADPREPALPISMPADYAPQLAERIGRFHTLGMPEETWSLNQGHLDEAGYIDMVKTTLAEGEAMLYDALAARDSELVMHVFVQPDRVSHMFWRGLDPAHPLHAESSPLARGAIEWIYRESDRVLAEVRGRMLPGDRLIVLSDHGFSSFRRAAHLNRWLLDHGYLSLLEGASESAPLFAQVDWSRSRAYALGLNGLYLNQRGRESQGVVQASEREALLEEIRAQLAHWQDGEAAVVAKSFLREDLYSGAEIEFAPDLVIGYAPGFRASWQTTLGAVPPVLLEDNLQPWSGDHCIDAEAVPGILLTSFTPTAPVSGIAGLPGLIDSALAQGKSP